MKVSFDFDSTLDLPSVQKLAKEILALGFDVWIVTTRYDDKYSTEMLGEPDRNADLYEVANEIGIPRSNIVFTNMTWKVDYFKQNPDFLFHLDDNLTEVKNIYGKAKVKTFSRLCGGAWYGKCLKAAKKYLNTNKLKT